MTVDTSPSGPAPAAYPVRVLLPWGISGPLTYLWPEGTLGVAVPGLRVEVPLGRSRRVGVVLSVGGDDRDPPPERLRPVVRVLDEAPLWSPEVLRLVLWAADYYRVPPGDFVRLALPPGLRRLGRALPRGTEGQGQPLRAASREGRPVSSPPGGDAKDEERLGPHALTAGRFLASLEEERSGLPVFLDENRQERLAFYREAGAATLRRGRSVLVLAPDTVRGEEILAALQEGGLPALFYHGDLPERDKARLWQDAARGLCPVLVGLRSAVFFPRADLGLFVVDEEHESTYRQEGQVPYHARDLAVVRARFANARVVLASTTPSLETVRNLRLRRYARLLRRTSPLPRSRPVFRRVDPRRPGTVGGLSAAALDAVAHHLKAGGRVAVYLNRRGYARSLVCPACGWTARCLRCGADAAVHLSLDALLCPHCGWRESLPSLCPTCAGPLRARGGGIERLTHVLRLRFPEETVCSFETGRRSVRPDGASILVGARRLQHALASSPASLLLVADADAALANPEFRARERFAQALHLLAAELVGTGGLGPEVLLQSRGVDEEALGVLLTGSYGAYARFEDLFRRRARLPPYAAWALIEASGGNEEALREMLERLRLEAEKHGKGSLAAYGPLPLFARGRARARARLLLQADGRKTLRRVIAALEEGFGAEETRRRRPWRALMDPETLL